MVLSLLLLALAEPRIAPPITLTEANARSVPTQAMRALTMRGVIVPPEPVRFRFQCLADEDGQLTDCISMSGQAVIRPDAFSAKRWDEWDHADPVKRAALRRMQAWQVPAKTAIPNEPVQSYLVEERVSAADVQADERAKPVDRQQFTLAPSTVNLSSLYPPSAMRAHIGMAIEATCRVLSDRSLLCRDAHLSAPRAAENSTTFEGERGATAATDIQAITELFGQSTILALARMKVEPLLKNGMSSVGTESTFRLNWALP